MNKRNTFPIALILILCFGIWDDEALGTELKTGLSSSPQGDIVRHKESQLGEAADFEEEPESESPDTKQFLLDTIYHYGFLWAGRLFYVRNKNSRIFDTSLSKWIDNITEAPEVDDGDGFETNFVFHPLFGAEYYLYYRARGHGILASALGSFIQSALFEYAIEGTVETPSLPDLILTPAIGVPIGIGLENVSDWLIERDNRVASAAGYIVNPMRIFFNDGKFGILNPLTGAFAFQGPFTLTPNKSRAIELAYPFFIESPVPAGRVVGSFEVVKLDKELGGEFIFYSIRAEFTSSSGIFGFYLKYPYAGVNNVTLDGKSVSDGFEFSNLLFGAKLVLIDSGRFIVSGGLEAVPPTAFKDNLDRLNTVVTYGRDLPLYLTGAVTLTPYLSAAARKNNVNLQGNLGIDLIFSAEDFEDDQFEARIKYGSSIGTAVRIPTSPSVFIEFNGYTLVTASSLENTDVFITPGVRFGKKYSPGFGLQIPVSGAASDIADASFIFDFQARF